ncbi:MAG: DUF4384 domain-containing protein [Candidatus Obscuribacterales bacterium]|nr:DUF4384 domain-containing protein [Candidatus Obscuribacterales bacterium]
MISQKKRIVSLLIALAVAGLGTTAAMADGFGNGAKGLFFEQLDSPYKSLNTGVQYYIELHRDGHLSKVTNKFGFKNGDKIRFHVKSNVDGYAYILLKSGSRGEQSVLFPDQGSGDDNKVKRGDDYVIPSSGFLTFDDNPGTEKVSLLLSRTPIDAQAYLAGPKDSPTLIASAMTGAKDLIPQRVLVHYSESAPTKIASLPPPEKRPDKVEPVSKPPRKPPTRIVASNRPKNSSTGTTTTNIDKGLGSGVTTIASVPPNSSPSKKSKPDLEGTVTVVSELPDNVLHIDVDLHHI